MKDENHSLEKQILKIQKDSILSKDGKQELIRFLKLHFQKVK